MRMLTKRHRQGTLLYIKISAELGKALFLEEADREAIHVLHDMKHQLKLYAFWDHLPPFTQSMLSEMMPQLGLDTDGVKRSQPRLGDSSRLDL